LFDLGNTLVHYFEKSEFQVILEQAILEVKNYLIQKGFFHISTQNMWRKVKEEDYESSDHSVRPLEERLIRIFQLDNLVLSDNILMDMCCCFMKPIFVRGHYYEDTMPTLEKLKSKGFKTAIVSNTTWGSPACLWRKEINRLGLTPYLDTTVFCRDVGWRKPAKQIFEYALEKLEVFPENCVFVGDDPRWDLIGPKAVGIFPIIVNRKSTKLLIEEKCEIVRSLHELFDKLEHLN